MRNRSAKIRRKPSGALPPRAAGVLAFVGYNYRWAPLVQYARQLIAEGKLGRLTHYHGRFLNGYASNPNGFLSWRFEQEQGLGTLGDLMSHVIDMAQAEVVANVQQAMMRSWESERWEGVEPSS